MINPKFNLSIVALLLLGACSGETDQSTDGMPIVIHPTVTTRATESSFETGDRIGLTIVLGGNGKSLFADNRELVYNGESFVAEDLKWFDSSDEGRFDAYYPYLADPEADIEVAVDQREGGYASSDILMAQAANVMPNAKGVSLKFHHAMAQVVVTIENNSTHEIASVSVGQVRNLATLDLAAQKVTYKVFSPLVDHIAQKVSGETFRAVIAPQEAPLTVTVFKEGGGSASRTFDNQAFYAGKSYRAAITIDDDFEIGDSDIVADGQIEDWGEGKPLVEG